MKNKVKSGNTVTLTAPSGGVVGGNAYTIGKLTGVATSTVAEGLPFEMDVTGVFDLPKKSTDVFTEGCLLYWDPTPGELTTTDTAGEFCGHATLAAANPSTSGRVRLAGGGCGALTVPAA